MKYYLKTHEWIEKNGDNNFRMGVSSYAADQLGDIVFVESKDLEDEFESNDSIAILESVKAVGDIYAPFSCKLLKTNGELEDSPEKINEDAESTWVIEIEAKDAVNLEQLEGLMDSEKYTSEYLSSL